MPGSKTKYIALMTFFGCSASAFGAIASCRSSYSRACVGYVYVRWRSIGVAITQLGNIIFMIAASDLMKMISGSVAAYVIGFLIWLSIELYFIFIIRSYAYEIPPPPPPPEYYNQAQVRIIYSQQQPYGMYQQQPQPFYPPGAPPQYPPQNYGNAMPYQGQNYPVAYGPPQNVYPVGVPVQGVEMTNQPQMHNKV